MCTNLELPGREFFIAGASGFIGSHLAACLGGSRSLSRSELDLSRPDLSGIDLDGVQYGMIAAGVTSIGACEADPAGTRTVNVDGTLELARQFGERSIKTVWFSSDYVFDGREGGYVDDAPTAPLNEYGRQKAEVETRLMEVTDGNCLILRLGKTYSIERGDGTLLDEMAGLLVDGRAVRAATDQAMNPTFIEDVVRAVHLLAPEATDVVNCCSGKRMTRYAVAQAVARALSVRDGIDLGSVVPISLDDLDEAFVRPRDTSLVCTRLPDDLTLFVEVEEASARLAMEYAT